MPKSASRLFVTWSLATLLAIVAMSAEAAEPLLYGGIEIGAKGVKGVAIPIDDTGIPNLTNLRKLKHTAVNNVTLVERKDGKFREDARRRSPRRGARLLQIPHGRVEAASRADLDRGQQRTGWQGSAGQFRRSPPCCCRGDRV